MPPRLRKLGDPARDDELALGLTAAEYNAGQVAAARRDLELAAGRLGDEDVRVSVASAMLGWSPTRLDRRGPHARGDRERRAEP